MAQTRRAAGQRRRLPAAAAAVLASFAAASAFCTSRPPPWPRAPTRARAAAPLTVRGDKLYEALGVGKDATVSEIKKAYYREAKNSHPDKHQGNDEMFKRFQEVAEAYQTLADPVRRQQYDLSGLAGLAYMNVNASRLFGPPPWKVMIGRTNHWLWEKDKEESMLGLLVASIPNGIAGVTIKTLQEAYKEALETDVAILLDRVSQAQAEDTVDALEEYGLAVKAEPIEGERTNEKESPLMYFRRMQRELGEASERLRMAAIDFEPDGDKDTTDAEFATWIDAVRSLRSELRAAARQLDEFREETKGEPKAPKMPAQKTEWATISAPQEPRAETTPALGRVEEEPDRPLSLQEEMRRASLREERM